MAEPESYRLAPGQLLAKARQALAEDDLAQASEKGWGAAAQAVKAAAQSRSWPHRSHRHLFDAIVRLANDTGDRDIEDLFNAANALHTNFYEGWLPQELVVRNLDRVEELVARIQGIQGSSREQRG